MQTLTGHGGTVTAVAHEKGCLVTCSVDCTVRVWRSTKGRGLLLYPWFNTVHILDNKSRWVTAASLRGGEGMALYVGDSEGDLTFYTPSSSASSLSSSLPSPSPSASRQTGSKGEEVQSFDFVLSDLQGRKHNHVHELGITDILLIPEQNFLCTMSHDCTVRVYDAMTGTPFLTIKNEKRCRFTAIAWHEPYQELFLADLQGYVYVWNIYMSKCIKTQRLHKGVISSIAVIGGQVLSSDDENGSSREEKQSGDHSEEGKAEKKSDLAEQKSPANERLRRKSSARTSTSATGLSEKDPKKEKLRSIEKLLVAGDDFFESWKISRDLKFEEYKGHSDPIVAVIAMDSEQDAYRAADGAAGGVVAADSGGRGGFGGLPGLAGNLGSGSQDESHSSLENNIIFSASLDNTIKCWDCYEGTCLYTLKETATEISCMRYLHNCK